MEIIKGDLIKLAATGEVNVILHSCNTRNRFGAGIAKQIRQAFPQAYIADCQAAQIGLNQLGLISQAVISLPLNKASKTAGKVLTVVNMYTQDSYSTSKSKVYVDYLAFAKCLSLVKLHHSTARIGIPSGISSGLANGNKQQIHEIIDRELNGLDYVLVDFVL